MESKDLTCITCPLGCALHAERADGASEWIITGNTCPRGAVYAKNELTHPTRTLTTTIRVKNRPGKSIAVKTKAPISKEKMMQAMEILRDVQVEAPVAIGDVVLPALLGEADVVAASAIQ